ncbi:MAG: hypothetical protein WDN26_05930 [Chitinophagaceae bacterium]
MFILLLEEKDQETSKLLNKDQEDEECDATGDAMKNKSWLNNSANFKKFEQINKV